MDSTDLTQQETPNFEEFQHQTTNLQKLLPTLLLGQILGSTIKLPNHTKDHKFFLHI